MIKGFRKLPAVLLCILLGSSCEPEDAPCLQPTFIPVRIEMLHPVADSFFTDTILPHPIWIAPDSAKAIHFSPSTSRFQIPLSEQADSCRWILQPDSARLVYDTLVFYYERGLHFLSNACGYTYFYQLQRLTTTRHFIDSARITNPDVNSDANAPAHVQIFM